MKKELAVKFFIFIGFVLLGLLLFSNIINSFFLSDDFVFIDAVKSQKSPLRLWVNPLFVRPVVMFSYSLDFLLWELNPNGYHLTNILLHSINAFLVFLFCSLLLGFFDFEKSKKFHISLFAGILFLVFSGHSESVSWVSGRTDVIATLFVLISFCCYLDFRKTGRKRAVIFSYLFFILALMSKESVILYPLLIFVFDLFLQGKKSRRYNAFKAITIQNGLFFLLLAGYFVFRFMVLGSLLKMSGEFQANFGVIVSNMMFYVSRSLLPFQVLKTLWNILLSADAGFGEIAFKFLIFTFFFGGLLVLFIKARKKEKGLIGFTGFAFLVSLIPVLNWRISIGETQNERFLYFPSVFICLLLVLGVFLVFKRKLLRNTLIGLLLILHIGFLYQSNTNWKAAGAVSRGILFSFITNVKENSAENSEKIFILNLPDNLNGAYIARNGFYESLKLFEPQIFKRVIVGISTHILKDKEDAVSVERVKEATYSIKLNREDAFFLQSPPLSRVFYEVFDFDRNAFKVKFSKLYGNIFLLCYSEGKIKKIATIKGEKNLPFGLIHPLEKDLSRGSNDIILSGVVVGDTEIQKIEVKRNAVPSDPLSRIEPDGFVSLGEVSFEKGKDFLMTSQYPNDPFKFSFIFTYIISRDNLPENLTEPMKIHVVVFDKNGRRVKIGTEKIGREPW